MLLKYLLFWPIIYVPTHAMHESHKPRETYKKFSETKDRKMASKAEQMVNDWQIIEEEIKKEEIKDKDLTQLCTELISLNLPYDPKKYPRLSRLTTLSLKKRDIINFTDDIKKLIILRKNAIGQEETVQRLENQDLQNYIKLKSLDLSGNSITNIDFVTQLPSLTKLNVSNNKLTELPAALVSLKNLQELDVRGNSIENLPEFLTKLSHLSCKFDLPEEPITESDPNQKPVEPVKEKHWFQFFN